MEERIIKDINNLLTQLFQKMNEAGYEWDAEKKELKKIGQNPAWSEEDEKCIRLSTAIIDSALRAGFCLQLDRDRCVDWLKSLRPQNRWKPSDEQMDGLNYVVNFLASSERPIENDLCYNILKSLRQQLKKLRKE